MKSCHEHQSEYESQVTIGVSNVTNILAVNISDSNSCQVLAHVTHLKNNIRES